MRVNFQQVAWRMCGRKRAFKKRVTAQQEANRLRNQGVPGMRVYRCLFCDTWHLTSRPEREQPSDWLFGPRGSNVA